MVFPPASLRMAPALAAGFRRGRAFDQRAVLEGHHAIHGSREAGVVRDHDQTRARRVVELQHEVEDPLRGPPVEIAGGFVREHAGRPGNQRPGDGGALPFATGELRRLVVQPGIEADARQHLRRRRRRPGMALPPHQERHGHVFQSRELHQQVVKLVDEAQCFVAQARALRLIDPRQEPPSNPYLALAGRVQAAEQVQQRALAAARSADDGDPLAGRHRETHPFQHLHRQGAFVEGPAQVPALDDRRLTHSARPRRVGCGRPATPDTGSRGCTW